MDYNVNIAIQVLPLHLTKDEAYRIVDVAIDCIKSSGMKYIVCPFETVVEGPYDRVKQLLDEIHSACYAAGAHELILNMKLQTSNTKHVAIDDKIAKYQ
jgi:uncharacterized protein YqgV (UPF0045/DUF77 family)